MLALVSPSPKKRGLLRRLRRANPVIQHGSYAGLRILHGYASDEREADVLCRELLRLRADRVCFEDGFAFRGQLRAIPEASAYALVSELLTEIAGLLSRRGQTAYFCGGASPKDVATLETLCRGNRYVLADTKDYRTARKLRGDSGVSVVENPSPGLIKSAGLAVFTRSPERETELAPDCVALPDSDASLVNVRGVLRVTGVEVRAESATPDGFSRLALLAEAVRRGAISPGSVKIMKILTNA